MDIFVFNDFIGEGVKEKLNNLVSEKSIVPWQQYQTTYKNSTNDFSVDRHSTESTKADFSGICLRKSL